MASVTTASRRRPSPDLDPVEYFQAWKLSEHNWNYLLFHRRRYQFLLDQVTTALTASGAAMPTILDVSPMFQTELMRQRFPTALTNSLGYGEEGRGWGPGREGTRHWQFDLNDCDRDERWPDVPAHDVVVMAEVIEHLHTAPEWILRRMNQALRPGGRLIIQTPNATALPRRLALLFGRHPYQRLQPWCWDPGDIRQYTRAELVELAEMSGFVVESVTLQNCYEIPSLKYRLYNAAARFFPPTWREDLTVLLRKTSDPPPYP